MIVRDRPSLLQSDRYLSCDQDRIDLCRATARRGVPLTTSDREVVAALAQAIVQRIGEPRYNLWFHQHTKFSWDRDRLIVGVPNLHFQEWLQKTFAGAVQAAAVEVFGQAMQVGFTIDPELFQAARREQAAVAPLAVPSATPSIPAGSPEGKIPETYPPVAAQPASKQRGLFDSLETTESSSSSQRTPRTPRRNRRWHRLEDFVVGACNRLAHASALSIVEEPGQGITPLVLHGPVGTGKTHLLEGIYIGFRKRYPDWRICLVTSEDFTNRFVQSMRLGKLGAFRKHFRECDVLLVDDLQFLATKRATQEEFLHTFDALVAEGRQVVATCDCHPRLADEFPPELLDRLLGGSAWGLLPPDLDTRLAILRRKSSERKAAHQKLKFF